VEVKGEYQVKISNKSATMEDLDDNVGVNRASKSIREHIKEISHRGS
jgi:hypothetical protein